MGREVLYVKPNSPPPELPGLNVEKLFLYQVITSKAKRCIYVEINDQILISSETRNFVPREWIDNMPLHVQVKRPKGDINRVIFSPTYTMMALVHDNHWWYYALHWESRKLFNCGIMVLKYLELWEPKKKYDGKSMFAYIGEELQQYMFKPTGE
ncbi:hypothetical protein DEO72_LG8g2541 [Vigna unguiculata]|uniref:Uncharacterized protein n=1 Tax=Vigna unguiculata TaxID=3917 RepID=A0A4D6MX96_VIGUN|nr:hypothetical protein DEO72_LG8g2541 [Vigna unguiculata]